jgi:hypothetical protein
MKDNIDRLAALQQAGGLAGGALAYDDQCSLGDFYAYMPMRNYIYAPTREPWPAGSVDARIAPIRGPNGKLIKPSAWLAKHRAVEQMSWLPGAPMLIRDRLIADGGWVEHPVNACFNLYRAPTIEAGDATMAGHGWTTSRRSSAIAPATSSAGWRTACSARRRRSITG